MPRRRASVASARVAVQVQMIDSSGTVSPPSAPEPRCGQLAVDLGGVDDLAVRRSRCVRLVLQAGQRVELSSVQATSSAPVRSTGMPVLGGVVAEQS